MVRIKQLVWDEWNVEHISRHSVGITEVERAISDPKTVFLSTYNGRILVLGRSHQRLLSVVIAEEEKGRFYVVTARDMSKKERGLYRNDEKHKKIAEI